MSLVVISRVCRLTQFKYILIRELLNFPKLCVKDIIHQHKVGKYFLFLSISSAASLMSCFPKKLSVCYLLLTWVSHIGLSCWQHILVTATKEKV